MKTVIFLGAGASGAEGAPLQNNLFRNYFEMRKYKNRQEEVLGLNEGNNNPIDNLF